jgi:hypothetical protein
MGTRGFYGFRYKGRYILFYNHWDSYYSGLGNQLLDELRKFTEEDWNALMKILKKHLKNGIISEEMECTEGKNFEGLMKAATEPTEYALSYVGREPCPPYMMTQYTYIVDLDKNFLRVTGNDNDTFKFPLFDLPASMNYYNESDRSVDTDLEDTDEE